MSQRFCTNCGAALMDGAAFCTSCGTPAQAAAPPQPAMPPPAPAYAPAAAYPPQPAAPPPYAGQGGYQPPPAYPGGYPGAAPAVAPRASGWTWQRWALIIVGGLVLLGGLKQMGVLDMANNSRVVGRWAPDSRCIGATTLNANGTFLAPNGGTGRWTLNGDRLTLSGANGSTTLRLLSATRNSITVQGADGQRETLVRC